MAREEAQVSSTPAAAAVAQTRGEEPERGAPAAETQVTRTHGKAFELGPGVARAVHGRPYERAAHDPIYRPLRIYSLDPSASRRDGAVATVNVPFEPVAPGPVGSVFEVDPHDAVHGRTYRRLNLDDPSVLIRDGRDPSPNDPLFHQQMTYAVCSLVYAAFRSALGRHVAWGFDGHAGEPTRLLIRPHGFAGPNACYDKATGSLSFGVFEAPARVAGTNLPGGLVFTCLSHDVIAHEVTHALLDGLRGHFDVSTGPDVAALHESFADLIAIFQHFSYAQVVRSALRRNRGRVDAASPLTDLARQLGQTTGCSDAMRSVADALSEDPPMYHPDAEPHALGSVLAAAVFEAFLVVYRAKTERYVRLATGGTGVLPEGQLPHDLEEILAEQASKIAGQFQAICIRAIDYCPPVDPELGNYLRALVTADLDLVPDDRWHYREALITAFGRRGIYPRGVLNLSEDALRWRPPRREVAPCGALSFARLQFDGDPGRPAGAPELVRQAEAVGSLVSQPELIEEFGLARSGDPRLRGDAVSAPVVESVRSSRRVGPDGQVVFDLVAEVTQRRWVRDRGTPFEFLGGATLLIGPSGEIRYVISKNVLSEERLERQRAFLARSAGCEDRRVRCRLAPAA